MMQAVPDLVQHHTMDDDGAPPVPDNHPDAVFSLGQFQTEVATWASHNFPNAEQCDPLLGLVEEVGELAHAFLKRKQGIRGTAEEHTAAIKDAVGDAVVFLAHFCFLNDIDLETEVRATWDSVKQRDWQKNSLDGSVTPEPSSSVS